MKVEYGMYRHTQTHMHNLVYSIGYDVLSFCLGMLSFVGTSLDGSRFYMEVNFTS